LDTEAARNSKSYACNAYARAGIRFSCLVVSAKDHCGDIKKKASQPKDFCLQPEIG